VQRTLLLLILASLVATSAAADPAVIREGRLYDLAVTPALGRGYSPSANSLHSICFDHFDTTTASYDFDYVFEEVEADRTVNASRNSLFLDSEVERFLKTNTREKSVVRDKQTFSVHYIMAILTIDSYYSAIDESKATLSANAITLLQRGDMLGFFSGCGTHYLRSISRRSYFLTLFSYTSSSATSDRSFERKLEQEVRRFGTKDNLAATDTSKFEEESKSHDLKIVSKAIGLLVQQTAKLLPTDLASYKESLKAAFLAAQNDFVGRITAIEITPWMTNPSVLALLDTTAPAPSPESTPAEKTPCLCYARKQLLADNAEFYIAMSAQVNEARQTLHMARVCRADLERRVLNGDAIPPALAKAKLINHRTGEETLLAPLVEALTPANIDKLDAAVDEFENGKNGVAECIKELEQGNLMGSSHLAIPACRSSGRSILPNAQLINDYCMPEIAAAQKSP
jgi:hypothetical protein